MEKSKKKLTREELITIILAKKEELGKTPRKRDMDPDLIGQIRREFGRWCYALEDCGLKHPSKKTLARRDRQHFRHKSQSKDAADCTDVIRSEKPGAEE